MNEAYAKNIAVIGSGYWGKNLVRNHYELGSLAMVCDRDGDILKSVADQYDSVETSANFEDVLENPAIAGVVVALPAEMHYAYARRALEKRKHVFVEKPLALDLSEAEALVALAKKEDRVLMVGHLLQYHSAYQRLKELVHNGDLGSIQYVYSNRLSLGKIRREENSLWSFAPHDISMILSLCQEEPSKIYARGGNYLRHEVADVTITHLDFPSGIKSHIFVSWLHPYKEQKLVVVGDRKMAVFSDTEEWQDKLLLYPHSITWDNGLPVPQKAEAERIPVANDEPLANECRHFLECMQTGRNPITDGAEGLRVLRVLNEAQKHL